MAARRPGLPAATAAGTAPVRLPLRSGRYNRLVDAEDAACVARRAPALNAQGYVPVIDVAIHESRNIPLEGVLCFEDRNRWYRVGRPRPVPTA